MVNTKTKNVIAMTYLKELAEFDKETLKKNLLKNNEVESTIVKKRL